MQRNFLCNGKVTYPQGTDKPITTFTFINKSNGEMLTVSTTDQVETDAFDYGDDVVITVSKAEGSK